jgi:5'-deoxynucleotidase YfbR-like HD superfamily hydrolase
MKTQLEFMFNGAAVKRYHTVNTLMSETVGHHSHGVAMICYILDPECRKYVLEAALLHDLAEHITGDIPAPAKRQYGIGDQVNELEGRLLNSAELSIPILTNEEKRTLKLADIAQGAMFCANEMRMGNMMMSDVFDRYLRYAEDMILVGRERQLFDSIKDSLSV